jgi:Spy/CpxP family protein refolding chaperone
MNTIITKNKVLIWVIVILAAINVSTLLTIIYHIHSSKIATTEFRRHNLEPETEKFSGRFFRDRLGLSKEQMDSFRESNRKFRRQAYDLTVNLSQKRNEMLEEMDKEHPDTTKLFNLSNDIGRMHSELKVLTYKYYLDIKNICTPEQKAVLRNLFKDMFGNDEKMGFPGRSGKHGMGAGDGKCVNNKIKPEVKQ